MSDETFQQFIYYIGGNPSKLEVLAISENPGEINPLLGMCLALGPGHGQGEKVIIWANILRKERIPLDDEEKRVYIYNQIIKNLVENNSSIKIELVDEVLVEEG